MQVFYNSSMKDRVKVQFPGLDKILRSESNLCQDMFVLSVLNGLTNGYYLEIGGNFPKEASNTYLLEKYFSWKGVSIEYENKYADAWRRERTNPVYIQDALTTDYTQLLESNNIGNIIDYLSCDIEPQDATFKALQKIDHDRYRFKVITFEHDHYNGGTGPFVREESRKFLHNLGYDLLVADASLQGHKIEDWWISPEYIDKNISKILRMANTYNAAEVIYR